jgi:hypothetical protein
VDAAATLLAGAPAGRRHRCSVLAERAAQKLKRARAALHDFTGDVLDARRVGQLPRPLAGRLRSDVRELVDRIAEMQRSLRRTARNGHR